MDQIMKISLTDEEINALAARYDTKNNSSINYKQFCNTINISNYIILDITFNRFYIKF